MRLCCLFLGVAVFSGPLSAEDFACYVLFPTRAPEIVLVETGNASNAVSVASRARSTGPIRRSEPVREVVECIPRLTGRFTSAEAQRLLEQLPL